MPYFPRKIKSSVEIVGGWVSYERRDQNPQQIIKKLLRNTETHNFTLSRADV
jgi:hypothetical protein